MNFSIEKHHPMFDKIVDADKKLEKIQGGFRFLEGPVWHPEHETLIFSDIIGNALFELQSGEYKTTPDIRVIRENSYLANGNTYDRQGRLLTCEHGTSRVTRWEKDGSITILASHYNGKELNSPNDIIVSKTGRVFFTDPNPGRCERVGIPRKQELSFQGVYSIDADGKLTLLVDDFSKPNGICLSLDEKQLFVNDTDRQHIRVFDLTQNGCVEKGRLWADLIGDEPGVADGMKLDVQGNLYCSGPGGIQVFGPDGILLGRFLTPEVAANFAWGGKNFTTMYMTAMSSLYRLSLNISGLPLF